MPTRVSYGACARCGGPILYQGAAYCSPQCNALPAREPFSLDSETELARPGLVAPPLACVSWATQREKGLVHVSEAKEHVVRVLETEPLISGFHVAFDMAVFCAQWPEVMPLVFKAYEEERVSDCMWREKLRDIAEGTYKWAESEEESEDGKVRLKYNLQEIAYRRCGIRLEKGTWQLRFGELIDVPMGFWPVEAQQYAVLDAEANRLVWLDQEREDLERQHTRGTTYFADEYRQARAYFWLQLMGCWGFHTDRESVRAFARKAQVKYETLRDELLATGIVKEQRTTKKATGLVEVRYVKKKKPVQELVRSERQRKGQQLPYTKKNAKKIELLQELIENESVPARLASLQRKLLHALEAIQTDKDVCSRSEHPLLQKYADFSHWEHVLKQDVPLLERGLEFPIQGKFDLADTGRTTSTLHFGKGNTQNWSTSNGMRECAVPRPGCVYIIGDYAGFELRTWSQLCLWQFGQTLMGQMLNQGLDPHMQMAAWILKISYEEALADFERDPKGRVYYPRQTGKCGNFGLPGGLGPYTFQEYARKNYNVLIAFEKAVELKDHWLNWPEAPLWLDWVKRETKAGNWQYRHPVSHRYRKVNRFTEFANGPFQALAADAAKNAGFLIAKACYAEQDSPLYGCRPCMFIHDEFVVEVPDDQYAHERAHELARLMKLGADPFLPDIPPVVDPVVARVWSKAAKAVRDHNGRLIPWVPKEKAA